MTREELMLVVVETARGWLNAVSKLPYQTTEEEAAMGKCERALAAISALDAHCPEDGEMVEVYGAVRVDPKGYVDGRVFRHEKDARRMSREGGSTENGPIVGVFFTARVPLPRIPEVRATVAPVGAGK